MGEGIRKQGVNTSPNKHKHQLAHSRTNNRKVRVMQAKEAKDKAKHDTEKGLNARESATLAKLENQNTHRKTEQLNVIDADGNVVFSKNGSKNSVKVTALEGLLLRDKVMTHNHPTETKNGINMLGDGIAGRIGLPINGIDVSTAMRYDAKEIRASAQGYVFSVKRPQGGWRGTSQQVQQAFNYYWKHPSISVSDYTFGRFMRNTPSDMKTALNRAGRWNVSTLNTIMKKLAKQFGFTYTRRRLQ